MKNSKLLLFSILILIQLAIPLSTIVKKEISLQKGYAYKLRMEVVDPYDPFRGRYLILRPIGLSREDVPKRQLSLLKKGGAVYAELMVNADGFAEIELIHTSEPQSNYLTLHINDEGEIIPPFDRYYLNQKMAPQMEDLYRKSLWRGAGDPDDTFLTVNIKRGEGVITGLYIDGEPIAEIIERLRRESE